MKPVKLRIIVFSSRDISHPKWAGGDLYLSRVLAELSNLGHQIIIVCEKYPGAESLSILEGVRILRLRRGLLRPMRNFLVYNKMKTWADVVIEEIEGPAGPFFLALYVRRPLVGLWHQPVRKILLGQYPSVLAGLLSSLDTIYGRLMRDHVVITPSVASARRIQSLGVPATKTFVVPGAPDPGPQESKLVEIETPFFLTLGKYRKYKCFDHPILAMKRIVNSHPNCHLLLGGGRAATRREEEVLHRIARKEGVEANIRLQPLSQSEKNWALANSVALIVPSPIEGFSLVSVEANSFGTPVIASSGVPEDVIVDGLNGLRYKFGDINQLSEKMMMLLDGSRRAELSRGCKEFADRLSWPESANLFLRAMRASIHQ